MKWFHNYIPAENKLTFDELVIKTCQIQPHIHIQLDSVEQKISDFVKSVCSQTKSVVRIAGGWVRDKLLGVNSKDIDLVIDNMSGMQFGEACEQIAKTNPEWSRNIGQANRNVKDDPRIQALGTTYIQMYGILVDLVNLRKEDYSLKHQEGKGRAPTISFGSPKEDAERRDLTINSLYYNINTGQVEDFTGKGLSDLGFDSFGNKAGNIILRTPLDPVTTFLDDAVRILRVLRFYSRYKGSVLSPEIIQSLSDSRVVNALMKDYHRPEKNKSVTNEMLGLEIMKIMKGAQPEKAINVLYDTGLLNQLMALPKELHPLNMLQRNPHHELNLIDHIMRVLKHTNELALEHKIDNETRACMNMSALWHDIGKLDPRSHVIKPTGYYGYHGSPRLDKGEQFAPGVTKGLTHEEASVLAFNNFAKLMKLPNHISNQIRSLIEMHMIPHAHASTKHLYSFLDQMPKLWKASYLLSMADAMSKRENEEASRKDQDLNKYVNNINTLTELTKQPLPVLLSGEEYIELFPDINPRTGFIEHLKKMVREWQYKQPELTKQEAIRRLNSARKDIFKKFK